MSIAALDNLNSKQNIEGKNIVCILSGGNNDLTRYDEIMDLSLKYQNLKHYFIVEFSQTPGQLSKFINNVLGEGFLLILKDVPLIGLMVKFSLNINFI